MYMLSAGVNIAELVANVLMITCLSLAYVIGRYITVYDFMTFILSKPF